MPDTIKKIGGSILHYGKENDRIYLIKLSDDDCSGVLEYMNNLAFSEGYSKIVAKVPEDMKSNFLQDGYETEAFIKGFYGRNMDCHFMCKYFAESRKDFANLLDADIIRQFCVEKANLSPINELPKHYKIKQLGKEHIPQIIKVLAEVFDTYPFPVFDDSYVRKTMDENVEYYGVFDEKTIVAISSSEIDIENLNAEMTDFAVLPKYRGNNFSYHLLKEMEKKAEKNGILTLYTIARSKSKGMNITFTKSGYSFGGKLINNTNICGKIQTMNVWYKNL